MAASLPRSVKPGPDQKRRPDLPCGRAEHISQAMAECQPGYRHPGRRSGAAILPARAGRT